MFDQDNAASGFGGRLSYEGHPALLVVDFQRAFTQPPLCPLASSTCDDEIQATNQLIDAMRGRGPVVFTSVCYDNNATDVGVWIKKNPVLADLQRGSVHVALDERLHYDPSQDWLLYKTQASAFFGTPLTAYLARHRVRTLIVVGTTTSGCVRASVVDSIQNGFVPFVVEEGVCDRSAAQHQSNLVDMQSKYAEVTSLSTILKLLTQE